MRRRVACALLLLTIPRPAYSDEATARRLSALKRLVDPSAAPVVAPPPPAAAGGCARDAWWRTTAYGLRARIDDAVRDASLRFAVDRALIRAVIRHESAYDPNAVSSKGAMGLMQLMPATASRLGVVCAFDPRENVLGGTRYLRRLHDRLGSWPRAVAAYHAGPGRIETNRVPAETRVYVRRVMGSWRPGVRATLD